MCSESGRHRTTDMGIKLKSSKARRVLHEARKEPSASCSSVIGRWRDIASGVTLASSKDGVTATDASLLHGFCSPKHLFFSHGVRGTLPKPFAVEDAAEKFFDAAFV